MSGRKNLSTDGEKKKNTIVVKPVRSSIRPESKRKYVRRNFYIKRLRTAVVSDKESTDYHRYTILTSRFVNISCRTGHICGVYREIN